MERKIEALSTAEEDWLHHQLHEAAQFAVTDDLSSLSSLEALDAAWETFVHHGETSNEEANAVVICVGVAFGEHLVRALGFRWVIATDDWGTDLAVIAREGRGDVTIFPTDFVSKRWETIAVEWGDETS